RLLPPMGRLGELRLWRATIHLLSPRFMDFRASHFTVAAMAIRSRCFCLACRDHSRAYHVSARPVGGDAARTGDNGGFSLCRKSLSPSHDLPAGGCFGTARERRLSSPSVFCHSFVA